MDGSCDCAAKNSREPPPNNTNTMFRRILKKFKGSHPGDEDEENPASHVHEQAPVKEANTPTSTAEAKSEEPADNTPSESEDHDDHNDDDHSSSGGSDSSSEAYYSLDEMIIVPTRRISEVAVSSQPASEEVSSHDHFDLQLLARTHFPDFGVPDGEYTDTSDDESEIQKKEEKYQTKEDQDVAVFMDLMKRMSIKSLLHLLQGHVRTQNLPNEYLQQYNAALSQSDETKYPSKETETAMLNKPLPRKKAFRWAEITSEKVRVVVYEIESVKEHKDLWWTPEEMHAIRSELIDVVKFFRKRRPNYITSVEIVAKHQAEESVLEDHMKKLTEDSFARGLESHVVKYLSDHRKSTIQAVLEEQKECRLCNDNKETTMHCLREQSVAYSQMSTRFAACMAKCDEIDSLKASMSRWRAAPTSASPGFFDA